MAAIVRIDVTLNVTLNEIGSSTRKNVRRNDRLIRPKGGRTHSSAQVWT